MSLIQIPENSIEWDVSFFETIQPKIMMRLDEYSPGLATKAFEKINEEDIFSIFKRIVLENGYELVKQNNDDVFLVKTPLAINASKYIYDLSNKYCLLHNITKEQYFKINKKTQKSYFSIFSNGFLKTTGASKEFYGKTGSGYWKFSDNSCLELTDKGLKTWNTTKAINEQNFDDFTSFFKKEIENEFLFQNTNEDRENRIF